MSKHIWPTIMLVLWATAAQAQTNHEAVMAGNHDEVRAMTAQNLIDADAVEQQWRRVLDTFEEGDVDAFMALTTQDVVLMPPGERTLPSREAARSLMADFFGTYAIEIESVSLDEIVVAGDWAFVRDTYVSNLTPRSGGETMRARGKNVWILRRQADGSWKVARNMWNSSDPPTR